jgi:uncharacterized protein YdeI (YjbR/CyaY-like superfamily)
MWRNMTPSAPPSFDPALKGGMTGMNRKVDIFLSKEKSWREEFEKLRGIILDCDLKWGQPCYTYEGKNILLIHGFKDYCAILFMKGALLEDAKGILIQQTANVQSARQIRFTNVREIVKLKTVLKSYIHQGIEVEKAGMKVALKKTAEYEISEEFQTRLDKSAALKKAFYKLTPGRQRAYLLYFASAKQSKTREARVDKSLPAILKNKGLDD